MPTNKEQIKKALDNFEEDNYVDSEEELSKELKRAKNDYLKRKLGLENDVEDVESDDDSDNDNNPDGDNPDDDSDE